MILPNPKPGLSLDAEVCVIGSGAGGAAAAFAAAREGRKVVLLEAGELLLPGDFSQREEEMYPRLFYESGGRRTADLAIRVLHGKGVGGSTLHNINLCKRAPEAVIRDWKLGDDWSLDAEYGEVESRLGVRPIEAAWMNRANRLFKSGVEKLGYRGGMLSHNRDGCQGSGFCELGCAYDAKMNAARVFIPEALKLGATVLARTRASRVLTWADGAEVLCANGIRVRAKCVVVSAGAVETPALLLRSGFQGLVGRRLRLHPGAVAAGVFPEAIEQWKGIPQSYECTEFLEPGRADRRVWLVGGSAHPAGAASLVPGFGTRLREGMKLFPRLLALTAMLHDESNGSVSARDEEGARIDYRLMEADSAQLTRGLRAAARILFAAGAERVLIPTRGPVGGKQAIWLDSEQDLGLVPERAGDLELVSVHPQSSCWMGRDPRDSCCDPFGRLHGQTRIWVADTSLFPTSVGVPPQITTYALGLKVGRDAARAVS